MTTIVREEQAIRYYKKRVESLKMIENYINENGPTTFMDFVLDVDFFLKTLDRYFRDGYLRTSLIASGKQNGKERLILGINWDNVRLVIQEDTDKKNDLAKIDEVIKLNGPQTLFELSKYVPRDKEAIRYWRNCGLLRSEKVPRLNGHIIIITGVNSGE